MWAWCYSSSAAACFSMSSHQEKAEDELSSQQHFQRIGSPPVSIAYQVQPGSSKDQQAAHCQQEHER